MSLESSKNLKNKRLGEILKSLNLLSDDQLEEILEKQRESRLKLGEVLSNAGYVDKEIILSLIGKQLGYPYIKVSEYGRLPENALKFIPERSARMHMLVPFEQSGNILKIAMADPQDEEVREAISVLTGFSVETYITSEEEIVKAIDNNY